MFQENMMLVLISQGHVFWQFQNSINLAALNNDLYYRAL